MNWELFDSGTNRHGVPFEIYRNDKDEYRVTMHIAEITYNSGLIALDVAYNTKIVRKIERGERQ